LSFKNSDIGLSGGSARMDVSTSRRSADEKTRKMYKTVKEGHGNHNKIGEEQTACLKI
jgi:hypothetical protein